MSVTYQAIFTTQFASRNHHDRCMILAITSLVGNSSEKMVKCATFSKMYFKLCPVSHLLLILMFSLIVISLETPILPVKQWEEHLKLREMVEKIRKRQAGM